MLATIILFIKIIITNKKIKFYGYYNYFIFKKINFLKSVQMPLHISVYNLFIFIKFNICFLFKFGKKHISLKNNIYKNNFLHALLNFFYFSNYKNTFFNNFLLSYFKKIYFIKKKLLILKLNLRFKRPVFLKKRKTRKYVGDSYLDYWHEKRNKFKNFAIKGHKAKGFPFIYILKKNWVIFNLRKFNIGTEFLSNRLKYNKKKIMIKK